MKHLLHLAMLVFLVSPFSLMAQGSKVVEAFLEATGGKSRWEELQTVSISGTVERAAEVYAFQSYYDHVGSRVKYESESKSSVHSKSEFWIKAPYREWKDAGRALRITKRSFYLNFLVGIVHNIHHSIYLYRIYSDSPQRFQEVENPLKGSEAVTLELLEDPIHKNPKPSLTKQYFLFDPSTNLLTKFVRIDRKGEVTQVVTFGNYREVEGLKMAFTVSIEPKKDVGMEMGISTNQETRFVTYNQIKINEALDAEVFEPK